MRNVLLLATAVAITPCGAQEFGSANKGPTTQKKPVAASPPATTPTRPNRAQQARVPLAPFQSSVLDDGKLSPRFTGHNPREVVNGLESVGNLKKGEFETTAAFEARSAAILTAPYVPNLKLDDVHAFVVNVSKVEKYSSGVQYSYDADTNDVSVYVVPLSFHPNSIGSPGYTTPAPTLPPILVFPLSREQMSERQYMASNAYGATVRVTERSVQSTSLGFRNIEFIPPQKGISENQQPVANFKLDAALAEKELGSLKALFVVRLGQHFLDYDYVHRKPTRDSPTEVNIQDRIIRGTADEIVLFSGLTGRVFLRLRK